MQEFINEFYISLLENSWKLNEIDEMDIWYYLDLLNYKQEKEYWEGVDEALAIM